MVDGSWFQTLRSRYSSQSRSRITAQPQWSAADGSTPAPLVTYPCTETCLRPQALLFAVYDFGDSYSVRHLVGEGTLLMDVAFDGLSIKPNISFSTPLEKAGCLSTSTLSGTFQLSPLNINGI